MRTIFLAFIILLVSSLELKGQVSIGFSDSSNFQQLIDYRLPSWGYSQFSINSGGLNVNGQKTNRSNTQGRYDKNRETQELTSSNFSERFSISPSYFRYEESEQRILQISTSANFTHRFQESNSTTLEEEEEDRDSETRSFDNNFSYAFNANYSQYLSDRIFLNGSLYGNVGYRFGRYKSDNYNNGLQKSNTNRRNISFDPSIGIGFGRIRNVTTVLRAIRLKERYQVVTGQSLSDAEILKTAEQFTKYPAYTQTYDRPEKYFWGDMSSIINNKLDQLGAYDLFFLEDVFDEQLGARFEGAEVLLTVGYRYDNSLQNRDDKVEENRNEMRQFSIQRVADLAMDANIYKNLDLKNQVHIGFRNAGLFPLERKDNFAWQFRSEIGLSWLYILTDRWNINNTLASSFYTFGPKERLNTGDIKSHDLNTRLISSITYFIENRMGITGSVGLTNDYQYDRQHLINSNVNTTHRFIWNFQLGIVYYFNRNLF